MNNQKGFTLTELLLALWGLICVGGFITVVYVIAHFISKYW